jgi:hypothetical protein
VQPKDDESKRAGRPFISSVAPINSWSKGSFRTYGSHQMLSIAEYTSLPYQIQELKEHFYRNKSVNEHELRW